MVNEQRRKWVGAGLSAISAAVLLAGCQSLDTWQRKVIFQPSSGEGRWWRDPPASTEMFDLKLDNGHVVHAWHLSAPNADAPTVLYLHGARWNLNGSVFRMTRWHQMGFNILAIDYRGFGRSTESLPSEQTAAEDVSAAFAELKRRQPDANKRFVYGHSLGGAMAIDLAAREEGFAGVIVESTFTSIRDMVRETRWGWLPFIETAITQEFNSLAKIERVQEPLLFIHGTADNVVPHTMADRLYAAATSVRGGLKRLLKIEGASHSGASWAGGDDYARTVKDFVRTASGERVTLAAR